MQYIDNKFKMVVVLLKLQLINTACKNYNIQQQRDIPVNDSFYSDE